MIKEIEELNFPKDEISGEQYATMTQATVTLQDMGEKTITSTIKIDGNIAPDFSEDWEVSYRGEKYIMPLRTPQASKENTSLHSTVDLTFQHWAIYQLKRWYFFSIVNLEAGTILPDQYDYPVSLNLKDFCTLFGKVLNYYYGDKITMDFNDPATHENGWEYDLEPTVVEISHSYIWDVLIKLYELYGVRWSIEPRSDNSNQEKEGERYVIRVGYSTDEVDHIFRYGFEGGLLKVERQTQNEDIRNIIIGRGTDKNLPFRYYKDVDSANAGFPADPDWIPELSDMTFDSLRGATFRSYVQGWKCAKYNGANNRGDAYAQWAWDAGYNDTEFRGIEYVKDDDSIAKYGPLMGGIEADDSIYPSIQGHNNQIVAVDEITEDVDINDQAVKDAQTTNLQGATESVDVSKAALSNLGSKTVSVKVYGGEFIVGEGKYANLTILNPSAAVRAYTRQVSSFVMDEENYELILPYSIEVRDVTSNEVVNTGSGIPAGFYKFYVTGKVRFKAASINYERYAFVFGYAGAVLTEAQIDEQEPATFNVWIRNIWDSQKRGNESNEEYAERVWRPILGDHQGNEAKLVFSTGELAVSEDYEFTILDVAYDNTQRANGATSEWRLKLAKSEAEAESTGKYIPGKMRQARAGDSYVFTGIELPHQYILWAEEAIDNRKKDHLSTVKDIKPTWVVTTDRVSINNHGEAGALIYELVPGRSIRLADHRFIKGAYEILYLQTVTITYREPSSNDAALNPDVEIVLSDEVQNTASGVSTLSGEVSSLQRQVGALSNIEQIVRQIGDRLYLRKDGISDISVSPTEFANLLTSYEFRQGMVGGRGWGFYRDENGNWVLETDRIKARQDFEVNNLVVSQITARGGMIVESAAALEITSVEVVGGAYICYFDQKEGSAVNLFKENDIALCHRFYPGLETTPANPDEEDRHAAYEKFYKRKVTGVGRNYVMLSDSGNVNGSGVPDAGDVIVQWGNYEDKNRQYVIVRDVVGGGYERFIEGLDSVNAEGEEYYFVGRQAGMYNGKPRFYIGNKDGYIEYKNDKLTVKADISVESTFEGKAFDNYIQEVAGDETGTRNHAYWTANEFEWSDFPSVSLSHKKLYDFDGITGGDYVFLSFDYDFIDLVFNSGANIYVELYLGGRLYQGDASAIRLSLVNGLNKRFEGCWRVASDAAPQSGYTDSLRLYVENVSGGTIKIRNLMFQQSQKVAPWRPNVNDSNYLINALRGSTTLSGGLVLTSLVEVGNSDSGSYVARAGMSGLDEPAHSHGGPVFWGGGTYLQASVGKSTYVIYMDGTGHAANGTIKFQEDKLQVGNYVNLNENGLDMTINDKKKLQVGNYNIDADYIMQAVTRRNHGEVKWPYRMNFGAAYVYVNDDGAYNMWLDDMTTETGWGEHFRLEVGSVPAGSTLRLPKLRFLCLGIDKAAKSRGGVCPRLNMRVSGSGSAITTKYFDPTISREGNSLNLEYNISASSVLFENNTSDVRVEFWLENISSRPDLTKWTYYNDKQITDAGDDKGVVTEIEFPINDTTKLGADGVQMSWGKSNVLQKGNLWGVRVGEYGLKVTSTGLQIMTRSSNEWMAFEDYIKSIK